jgi:hypothetical protein
MTERLLLLDEAVRVFTEYLGDLWLALFSFALSNF